MNEIRELLKRKNADQPAVVAGPLFHASPVSRVDSILRGGLEPRAENAQDSYEPRIYLAEAEDRAVKIAFELRKALVCRQVVKRTWQEAYAILRVTPADGHPFWVDGYSQGGVYTDQFIGPERLSVAMVIPGEKLLVSNWPKFWNAYFWDMSRKLAF